MTNDLMPGGILVDAAAPPFRADPRRRCADVDPDAFFETGCARQRRVIRAHCNRCPLRATCRQWAIETRQQHGVWGGLTEQQLRAAVRNSGGPA